MAKSNAVRTEGRAQQGGGGGASAAAQRSGGNTDQAASDQLYGVVSVLYHALKGVQTYGKYVEDAQGANDDQLRDFFGNCRKEEAERARRAKSLLLDRLEDEEEEEDEDAEAEDDETSDEDEDESE
jgi:hypothetical protein